MIFVTVGMHTQPFDRLVRAADELAALLDERVIIQRGVASHAPRCAQHVDYVDGEKMGRWLSEARVVISHAGAGSILAALRAGKPLVLAPRMHRFAEHFDDHQFELAEALAEEGRAVMVTDVSAETLAEAVKQVAGLDQGALGETGLHSALRAWLAEQAAERSSKPRSRFRLERGGG
jgi:UDP-N-acetylglucosamine transferase subunit ALG13